MDIATCEKRSTASPLDHELRPYFDTLARFHSTSALKASSVYKQLRSEIERVLRTVEEGRFAPSRQSQSATIRATAWNIERGTRFEGILDVLHHHPPIASSDLLLLTELDFGMARSGNRHVAREIAERLDLNYAFAPCYINLAKGSGLDRAALGENAQALHGNAIFSRFPISRAHSIALPNGKDKIRGHEKRLGCQRAVVADVAHPTGSFRAVSLHLDAHSTQRHRRRQMKLVLDHLDKLQPGLPVVIGGDWNTTGYNSKRAVYSIFGFFRRVLMGVSHVIRNHYVYPERWFERGLFRELQGRGYDFRELNAPGAGTLHYDVNDLAANTSMADWVPRWCFWWLNWALKETNGRCSLKLDWFAGRQIEVDRSTPPTVVPDLRDEEGRRLSDHDPIIADFKLL
jgi:endonuclease/exonuclease/phosphatase family metal-dependent hydrolase